jgi:transcriptional regulator with XRE-family HTH domain
MYFNVHHKKKMKRTPDDDAYIAGFAPALKRAYEKAKQSEMSDQAFAESIGVERAQLDRYLNGESMPSVRTAAFAYREYRIAIPYQRISLRDALPKTGRKKKPDQPNQMVLPFTIQTEKATARVALKLNSVSARKFAFSLIVKKAG